MFFDFRTILEQLDLFFKFVFPLFQSLHFFFTVIYFIEIVVILFYYILC